MADTTASGSVASVPLGAPPVDSAPVVVGRASIFQEDRLRFEMYSALHGVPHKQARACVRFDIEGPLDVDALTRALDEVVRRHAILRTGFVPAVMTPDEDDSYPPEPSIGFTQVVFPNVSSGLRAIDLVDLDRSGRELALTSAISAAVNGAFDFGRPPLMHAAVVRMSQAHHVLLLVLSRLVCDGWSWKVLERELAKLYGTHIRCGGTSLHPLVTQFADFARREREQLRGETLRSTFSYWKRQLTAQPLLRIEELPFARARPSNLSEPARTREVVLDGRLGDRVRSHARESRVTLYALALTAVMGALHRYTGRRHVAVVGQFANRASATQGLIGPFSNPHVISVDCGGDPALLALRSRVVDAIAGAAANQAIPWAMLSRLLRVRSADPAAQPGPSPYIDFYVSERTRPDWGPTLAVRRALIEPAQTESGLTLVLADAGSRLALKARYAASHVEDDGAQQLLERVRDILAHSVDVPRARLSTLFF